MRLTLRKLLRPPALALALCALLAAPARAETYWLDGYEVEVTLRPWRESFVLGEAVSVALEFENRADGDLELLLSGEQGRGWPDDFEVRVTGPDGAELPRPPAEERQQAGYTNSFVRGRLNNQLVAARVAIVIRLDEWAKFEKPGVYTVSLRRGVKAGPFNGKYRVWPETSKPVVELRGETQVKVVAPGLDPVGALIEELGAKMLGGDRSASVDAAMRLAELKDERVVKHFVEALAKCRNTNIRDAAVRALGNFETDAAFEGLKLAAADPSDDLRTLAAQTLSESKHPKAAALLLGMRGDEHFGVRLFVLRGLAKADTAEARRMIWEMSNDEHPLVREEALRYLRQHGAGRRH